MNATAREGRCLGLIGGLGLGATVHYYRALVAAHEKQARIPRLLITHADVQRVYAAVTAKDFDGLAHFLAGLVTNWRPAAQRSRPSLPPRRIFAPIN